ncbi:MAG: DegV family protein, partial [Candidatus Hodarchaeota archaeon]
MCDLPPKISERYGIVIVPGIVYINDQPFQSIDIHPEDMQSIVEDEEKTIKTGAPPPAAYFKAYESLFSGADIILSLHGPTKHTGVMNAAKAAARRLEDPSRVIHFECGVATIGLGMTAIAASIISHQVDNKQELIQLVQEFCSKIQIIGTVESFKYLQRSGRLRLKVASWIASTLSVKPVLLMRESDVFLIEKPRNRNVAIDRMVSSLFQRIDRKIKPRIVGVSHFGCEEDLKGIEKIIQTTLPNHLIIKGYADPMVAANTGPGLV